MTTQVCCAGCGRPLPAHQRPFLADGEFNLWAREGYCSYPCFRETASGELIERHERDETAWLDRDQSRGRQRPMAAVARREEESLRNAGVLGRVLARLLDVVAGAGGAARAMWMLAAGSVESPAPGGSPAGIGELLRPAFRIDGAAMTLSMIVGSMLLFVICQWLVGATPGKALLGIRVTTERGLRASFARVSVREVLFLFDVVFLGIVGFVCMSMTERRQRLGDMIARTVVIRSADERLAIFFKALGVALLWCAVWGALMRLLVVRVPG